VAGNEDDFETEGMDEVVDIVKKKREEREGGLKREKGPAVESFPTLQKGKREASYPGRGTVKKKRGEGRGL